jgi:hypothetical protein
MAEYYALNDDKSVTPIADAMKWATAFEDREKRRVGLDELDDGTVISTVFLGLNHAWGEGPPLIFETMAFPEGGDEALCWRYSTYEQAERGHRFAVETAERFRAEGRAWNDLADVEQPSDSD